MQDNSKLKSTLTAPAIPRNIPPNSQWLSGEGAGSWFYMESAKHDYIITRYSPTGKVECSGLFRITNQIDLDLDIPFQFIHLSHCKSVTLQQHVKIVKMERINIVSINPINKPRS